jgi:hypothetical protein
MRLLPWALGADADGVVPLMCVLLRGAARARRMSDCTSVIVAFGGRGEPPTIAATSGIPFEGGRLRHRWTATLNIELVGNAHAVFQAGRQCGLNGAVSCGYRVKSGAGRLMHRLNLPACKLKR